MSGFTKRKICLTNLRFLYGTTGQVDEGRAVDVVYFDLYLEGDKAPAYLLL